jgi:hypothetical protein
MHGFIFLQLKKYVQQQHGLDTWHDLMQNANVSQKQYAATEVYPDADIKSLVNTAVKLLGVPANELLEELGLFLVPDLIDIYQMYINPTWRTLDLVAHTEETMHRAVRVSTPAATPPILHVSRVGKDKLIIDYHSHRKMAPLAVGIIKGIAKHYGESDLIEIKMTEYSEGERVQIDVHYKD